MLDIVTSYHCMQFQGKLMINFWPDLGPLGPNFLKNLASLVTRYHGQLSSCTISKKTNNPVMRKLSNRRTDGRTDWQTDKSDFIGRCPTNVESPIKTQNIQYVIFYRFIIFSVNFCTLIWILNCFTCRTILENQEIASRWRPVAFKYCCS